jgi:H+/gluconate symporter-like permease
VTQVADPSSGSANRFRLLRAPWWLLSLYTGVPSGLLLGVLAGLTGADGRTAATFGLLTGVLSGSAMGPLLARIHRRARPVADAIPDGQHRAVLRAAARGPVPVDPEIRAAALALATHQLAGALRFRRPVAGLLGLLAVLESAAALAYTPWLWVGAALFLAILVFQLRQPARLRRRIQELAPPGRE